MALFFNLDYVETLTPKDMVEALLFLQSGKSIPKSKLKFNLDKLKGRSFLLKPYPLLKLNIDHTYVAQYIKLAGRRDYSFYKQYGLKSLQLSYYPDINMDSIKYNPLLKITNKEIIFLYEE